MSKSKGNVMDPLELIDAYGADAVRFTLCALAGPGRDIKLSRQRIEGYRAFATKIWNAARFCEMNGIAPRAGFDPASCRTPLARWILDGANAAVAEANAALEAFRFDDYANAGYRFAWNGFCDWFLEFAKPVLNGPDGAEKEEIRGAAQHVLGVILKLLHPVMPFVTEELWDRMGYGGDFSLIRAAWPEPASVDRAETARRELDWVVRIVSEIRSARADINMPPKQRPVLRTVLDAANPSEEGMLERISAHRDAIMRLGGLGSFEVESAPPGPGSVVVGVDGRDFFLEVAGHVDLAAERTRLAKERGRIAGDAGKIAAKLARPDFVSRAPEEVVEENRERLAAAEAEMARLDAALARIAG